MPEFKEPLPVGKLETEEERRNVDRNFRDIVNDTVRHLNRRGKQFPQEHAVHGAVVLKQDIERGLSVATVDLEGASIFTGRDNYNVKLTVEMGVGEEFREARTVAVRRLDGRRFEILSTADNDGRNIGFTAYGN